MQTLELRGTGHSPTGYWVTGNPGYVLTSIYSPMGFDWWTNNTNYTGVATHSIHDSFNAGTQTSSFSSAFNAITKGWAGVQTASVTDDVISVIFQDESYAMYHNKNATNFQRSTHTYGTLDEPTQLYRQDHATYFNTHNSVTATTIGGAGGSIRSLLYPTAGGSYTAGAGFALHSVAAVHSGDNDPKDGKWTSATYPANMLAGHAQCQYNLSTLASQNPILDNNNPNFNWGL